MAQSAPTLKRMIGIWRLGSQMSAGDVCVVGRWAFEALVDHVSGPQSQPNFGDHWAQFWKPVDGYELGNVVPLQIAAGAPQAATPLQLVPAASSPTPVPLTAAAPPASPVPSVPAAPPSREIAPVPASSEIVDDSDLGMPNVAMSLSWLKAMVVKSAQAEYVDAEIAHLEAEIDKIRAHVSGAPARQADPIEAELWRRKCLVLDVDTRGEAEGMILDLTREHLRLLAKRDRGGIWTTQEAARATVLEVIDNELVKLDEAARAMRDTTPPDVRADRHWPRIGGE